VSEYTNFQKPSNQAVNSHLFSKKGMISFSLPEGRVRGVFLLQALLFLNVDYGDESIKTSIVDTTQNYNSVVWEYDHSTNFVYQR